MNMRGQRTVRFARSVSKSRLFCAPSPSNLVGIVAIGAKFTEHSLGFIRRDEDDYLTDKQPRSRMRNVS